MDNILDLSYEQRAALAEQLCKERDGAAKAQSRRKLESVWARARKQYQTGDAMESKESGEYEKGETLDGPLTAYKEDNPETGSTVSVNITRPYTNAGTAQVANILLPTNKLPFKLELTAVSDLEALRGILENYPQLQEFMLQAAPELTQKLAAEEDESKVALEAAAKLIKDWLQETNWASVVRSQINESGKVGTGVIKGPFPKSRQIRPEIEQLLTTLPTTFPDPNLGQLLSSELRTLLGYAPSVECIKVENCFPDPECGSDHQSGRFFYERIPEVTRRQIEEYKDEIGYDPEALEECLLEDPLIYGQQKPDKNGPYEFWVRTGTLELKDEVGNQNLGFRVTILCNKRIIKSESFWLDTQKFPYWMLKWEEREGSWAGVGIPEQIETPQRGLNAAVRAWMDNLGYSVGPQILEQDGLIEPVDGNWRPYPYKRWKILSPLPGVDAVREAKQALVFLEFPNYSNEILVVINWWLRMAEDTTGLSLLLQGKAVTDAVGVSQQLMSNATTNLRLVIKEWDDRTCLPLISAYYEWVQLYGPASAKGDAVVKPLGSLALIVRELQQQALLQIGDKVVQPIYGVSPKKWMQLYLEGFQVDYETLALDEEERQQLQDAADEPDPKVVVAEIQAETDKYRAELKDAFDTLKLSVDARLEEMAQNKDLDIADVGNQVKMFQSLLQREQAQQPASPGLPDPALAPGLPDPALSPQAGLDIDSALDLLEEPE